MKPNGRRSLACVLALVAGLGYVSAARAQELSQSEKDRALNYLESTKKGVEAAVAGLSPAQWNFKPGPDRWSIAEVMEHIAAAEDMIRGRIETQVMTSAVVPRRSPEELQKIDDAVLAMIPDRSHKAQAPPPLVPSNRFGSPQGSEKHFLESRAKTVEFLTKTPGLRTHVGDSPLGMKLDGYEWVLYIAAHSERHTKQMLEVKAYPNFPKQ